MSANRALKVSVIGLGNMGSRLAEALLEAGHDLTIWNRDDNSCSNARPLTASGARLAHDQSSAVADADIVIICVLDYSAAYSILEAVESPTSFEGKTIVQLSSGAPEEARQFSVWATERGATYLDGVLMNTPSEVGTPDFGHIYAGNKESFEAARHILKCFGAEPAFVGENPSSAAALDVGFLSFLFMAWVGFLHGAAICVGEGVSVEEFTDLTVPTVDNLIAPHLPVMAKMISKDDFPGEVAKLDAYEASTKHIIDVCEHAGVDSKIPKALYEIIQAATQDGRGEQDIAGLFPILAP